MFIWFNIVNVLCTVRAETLVFLRNKYSVWCQHGKTYQRTTLCLCTRIKLQKKSSVDLSLVHTKITVPLFAKISLQQLLDDQMKGWYNNHNYQNIKAYIVWNIRVREIHTVSWGTKLDNKTPFRRWRPLVRFFVASDLETRKLYWMNEWYQM